MPRPSAVLYRRRKISPHRRCRSHPPSQLSAWPSDRILGIAEGYLRPETTIRTHRHRRRQEWPIVVSTRTAGIWRIRNQKWELFAEGTCECLGLVSEDDAGDTIVIGQKPELTRLRDHDHDGRADDFLTVCDDIGFYGNYHEYTHGPVRDAAGNYYFALNLCHTENERASYRADGPYMGSMGGFRGWCCRVTPAGVFEPLASGVRSPAGLGIAPDGRLLYADNRGEYMGSSKISYLAKDRFDGHPSGLVSLPGMKPDSPEIAYVKGRNPRNSRPCGFLMARWRTYPGTRCGISLAAISVRTIGKCSLTTRRFPR